MRIDYITMYDLPDRTQWPRTQLGMCQAAASIVSGLSDLGCGANFIGALTTSPWIKPLTRLKWSFYHHSQRRDYYRWAEPAIVRSYGRQVSCRLRSSPGDVALCVENALPIATVRSPKPIVLWTDAPLVALIGLYPYMSNLCHETQHNIRRWEAMAFDRCEFIGFSSDWAMAIAQRDYPRSADKMGVIPWGANLMEVPDRATVHTAICHRSHATLELLFIGKEWERKGGLLALEIVAALRDRSIPARLTVIGCTPSIPPDLAPDLTPHIRLLGYLHKTNTTDRDQLQHALLTSHYLLLPTQAETYGHVLCEAAAFGLPAIATRVGGIATIIRDGKSGYTFEPGTTVEPYVTAIAAQWHDRDQYQTIAHQAREEFETRLNWAIACEHMRDRLDRLT